MLDAKSISKGLISNHLGMNLKLQNQMRAARRLVKLKRQEIDSVQDKINRVKNSVSVMDITNRIAHMEHMIEHETHPLKEEMQLLCELIDAAKDIEEGTKKLRELQARFRAANDIRQDAYKNLLGLKRQLHEKVLQRYP
ncbi:hypothetical protein POM88_012269 [Heracleum sosnowskyi]|uniref:Uncharacterized protein n=1 Tax=Heracleum sosnowskyi TaxID=360622 RepID=A0AAD8N378_9APIA|nr:hypothetical protein POM88_012269 [Heracleum sosnowskyi]